MTERTNDPMNRQLIEPFRAVLGDEAVELLEDLDAAQIYGGRPLVELEELARQVEAQFAAWELAGDVARLAAFGRALFALDQITDAAE